MQNLFILLAVALFIIIIQTGPAYCAGRTVMLEVSATLPEHAMDNNDLSLTPFAKNILQLVQTDTVIRNNQSIRITSIVVP